jgi:hypothetical protein
MVDYVPRLEQSYLHRKMKIGADFIEYTGSTSEDKWELEITKDMGNKMEEKLHWEWC